MEITSYLTVLINLIIRQYFNNSICIMYMYETPDTVINLELPSLLIEKNITDVELDERQICKHFLMHYKNASTTFEAWETTIKLTSPGMYNTRRYLLIIDSEDEFIEFFNSSALIFVRDVLVVYLKEEYINIWLNDSFTAMCNVTQIDLYTHRYVGIDNNTDAILLDSWFPLNGSFLYGNVLYPDKISNQYGRELRAPCFHLIPYADCNGKLTETGNEHNIILKYAAKYNYTLNLYFNESDYYGYLFSNWTGEGAVYGLYADDYDGYRDVIYGGFPKLTKHLDLVRTVMFSYEVSVPLPQIKYGWFAFSEVFTGYVWLLLFAVYVCSRALVFLRKEYVMPYFRNGSQGLGAGGLKNISTFGLLINQPGVINAEIRQSKFLKYIIMLLLVTSVLLVTAYSSRLSSVMVSPVYINDIRTLSELSESDYKIMFFDNYFYILANDERTVYKKLYEKIYLLRNNTDFELSLKLINSREYAVARYRRSFGSYFENDEHLQQMNGKFRPVTPELFNDFYFLLLRKNSMHTYELNKLFFTASETGLMEFWEEDALRLYNEQLFQMQMQDFKMENQNIDLNLNNLKGCFAFWGIGLAISLVFFLKEFLTSL